MEVSIYMSQIKKPNSNIEKRAEDPYDEIFNYLINYSENWEKIGVSLTQHVYSLFDQAYLSPEGKFKKLLAYEQLKSIIESSQKLGKFDNSITAEKALEAMYTFCRGIIFEWILFKGSFSLTERAREILPRYLKTYIID